MEIVGYAFRYLSSQVDPYHIIYFVIQYFFIVVAPVFFSASIYTILSIMIQRCRDRGGRYSPLSPKVLLWTFIACDVVATVVQVASAALIGVRESNGQDPTTANNILLAGLAFQAFDFVLFIICMTIFLVRSRKETRWIGKSEKGSSSSSYRIFIFALITATFLIYLRTCFRLAETAQGLMQELSTREVYFGTLEFAPVVLACFLFNVWHPGRILGRNAEREFRNDVGASADRSDSVEL